MNSFSYRICLWVLDSNTNSLDTTLVQGNLELSLEFATGVMDATHGSGIPTEPIGLELHGNMFCRLVVDATEFR